MDEHAGMGDGADCVVAGPIEVWQGSRLVGIADRARYKADALGAPASDLRIEGLPARALDPAEGVRLRRCDGPGALSPAMFFALLPVLERLARSPVSLMWLQREYGEGASNELRIDVGLAIRLLDDGGYAEPAQHQIRLTRTGAKLRDASGPPLPPGLEARVYAAEMAAACADHYSVALRDLYRDWLGPAVTARGRLFHAMRNRVGWAEVVIAQYFGVDHEWVTSGIERWERHVVADQATRALDVRRRKGRAA